MKWPLCGLKAFFRLLIPVYLSVDEQEDIIPNTE